MSRTIKFRGKSIYSHEWVYGCGVLREGDNVLILGLPGAFHARVEPGSEGQFTGLLDKNGKEVFENDIVEVADRMASNVPLVGVITYYPRLAYFATEIKSIDGHLTFTDLHSEFEILGNVYENEDLLK